MAWSVQPAAAAFPGFAMEWDRLNGLLHGNHPLAQSDLVAQQLAGSDTGQELLCIHRTAGVADAALILSPCGLGRWQLFLPADAPAGTLLVTAARCLESLFPALPGLAWVIDLPTPAPQFQPDWRGLLLARTVARRPLCAGAQADAAMSPQFLCVSRIHRYEPISFLHRPSSKQHGRRGPVSDAAAGTPAAVDAFERAEELTAAARALFDDAARENPECSLAWFSNLHRTVFGSDRGIRYLVARTGAVPTAALAVHLARHGLVRQIESLSNYYTSLYSPILTPSATAADMADLLQAADRQHGQAHVMRFWPMDPESSGYEALLAALRSNGWLPFRYFCFGNWFLDVSSNWSDYLRGRDGQLRSTIRRMGRKFAAAGGSLDIVSSPADVDVAIQAFNCVYALSWKRPEPYPDFVPGLIRWLADQGQLRLGIARLAGQPVAAQLWIVGHGRASIFKLAYDEAYAAYSPGTLLTAHLLEQVMDRDQVREVDYLIGDDRHKERWMSDRRERWGIVAYNPRTLVGLALLWREILGRAARQLTRSTGPMANAGKAPMNWTILPIRDFEQQASHWDGLVQAARGVPFLESAFLGPLLKEFGTGREVLALAYQDGQLRAAAILARKGPSLWQTFQPSQLPLGAWVSMADLDVQDASQSLVRALPGLALSLGITQQDPMLTPRPDDGRGLRTMDYIDTAWVDIEQSFDEYWEARGKNLKGNTRKQRSKLQTDGIEAHLDCIREPAGVAAAIDAYGRLESAGWKGKDGTAVHPDNAQGRFYRQMLENFCALGRGRIYRYRFGDQVVAMDLCIEAGDRIVILKTAYDESYKSISPSTLMRQDEFRELFQEGCLKRIEFYGKVMEWHSRWTDKSRRLFHLTCYRWNLLNALHARYRKLRHGGSPSPASD